MRLSLQEVRRQVKSELAKLIMLQTLVFSNDVKGHRLSPKKISSPLAKINEHLQSNGEPTPFSSFKCKRATKAFERETSQQQLKPILTSATSIRSFNHIDEDSFLKCPSLTVLNQNNTSELTKANLLLEQKVKKQHELIEELQSIIDRLA